MDRLVELCGRAMHIGRPKGYTEPAPGSQQLHPVPKAPPKAGDVPKQVGWRHRLLLAPRWDAPRMRP